MPAGPEAKESPGFFDLMAFFRSPDTFSLWFSADSRRKKLNSDKVDQWRIRRRMWRNMYQYWRSFSHKVTTRRFCPQQAATYLDAGRRIKDCGRPVDISWQKAKSTRNCGARLRLAPIIDRRVVTFLWASPVWRQTGQAQKNGAHWLRSGTTCTSTRFFAKYTHFAIVIAGSAEGGTLLLWNGGWSIRLAALEEELRLSKVEEKCTVPEVQWNQFFLFKTLFEKIIDFCLSNRLQTSHDHSSGVNLLPEWFIFAKFFPLQRFS